MKKVYILLANGFEDAEALVPRDVLLRGDVLVKTVSIMETKTVVSARNLTVEADLLFSEIEKEQNLDSVILPGGMPGAEHLNNEKIHNFVKNQKKECLICAICAAPMVLGDGGLLENRNAVCYPGFESHLKGAKIQNQKVVKDENFITAIGMGASFEFAFEILRALTSENTVKNVKDSIFY